jgi:peptide/nickel transport system substrate-binding protein
MDAPMAQIFRRFLLCLCLACGLLPAQGQAETRDTLTIGIIQFPSNFNPLIEGMVAKNYILGMALRPFTVYDKDWTLVCMLCTKLPTLENGLAVVENLPGGQKGVAITYTIQPEAKWGDGIAVTTKDVIFTWEAGKHPQSGVSNGDMFRRIRAIDVKDDKTFTLHVSKLTFDYNAINDFQLLPEHLEKKAFAEPAEYRTHSLYDTDTTNPGLYMGPYRISEVARGQYVVLEVNPTWWGPKPTFKRIIVKAIETTPSLEANLISGGIDMIAGEIGFTLDAALAFETRHRPEWRVIFKPGLSYEHLSLNLDNPVLADRRVRRALLMALDRQTMLHQIFQDKQVVANGPVNPLDWVFDPGLPTVPYDPDKAGALLDEVGWAKGSDGVRRNPQGQKLTLELMTTAGLRNREVMELVIQQAWKHLGVEATIRNQPARTFFGESVLRHNFPATALFAWMSAPESVPRTTLHSEMVPSASDNFAGQNVGGYRSQKMDALIDAIETELNRDKRRELWKQLQALYAEDLPDLPLTFRSDPYVLPIWLKGVEPTGHQYPTTLWVESWRAE